ncbi:hypothetical protein A1O1_06154 [Capronia coronata CBS 617.96]|uniref:Uncharacterized protein n=1 Tax=Capronia coronata CBS 617.96 TaxID=1182541 RepID=W9Y958_9EURO|nr:uncharacterized protein A1O1_06154 [Capronia coronata CBS 617.96]EXJ85786.1 hypothetical protein A1O1_06154 [Capronia coronata CBS 617.96]
MATTYGIRDLYGGAMTVELPVDLIDSSDLRQIPDHQEVFLSPTTLTSLIFEINDYADGGHLDYPTTTTTTTTRPDGTTTTTTTTVVNGTSTSVSVPASIPVSGDQAETETQTAQNDAEAAKFHFTDVISPPDTLASPLPTPQRVTLQRPSLAAYPAYIVTGNIRSHDQSRRAEPPTAATATAATSASLSSSTANQLQSLVHQIQLLIRMEDYATDLCVRVNVPLKELVDNNEVAAEAAFARDLIASVVATLDVVDFGLFGN